MIVYDTSHDLTDELYNINKHVSGRLLCNRCTSIFCYVYKDVLRMTGLIC